MARMAIYGVVRRTRRMRWFCSAVGRGRFLRRIVGCGCVGRASAGCEGVSCDAESVRDECSGSGL